MPVARRLVLALVLAASAAAFAAPALALAVPVPTLVVGDSLAVGMQPFLPAMVPDSPLTWDARSGRTTPQGLRVLRTRLREVQPAAVVISLGSNDGPSAERFADRVRRVLAAIPAAACVVWPSIVRPPRKGDETGLNRVLARTAARYRRVNLVDWRGAVAAGRVRLPDGLHPDPAGYEERSRMIAAALQRGCAAADGPSDGAPAPGGAPAP